MGVLSSEVSSDVSMEMKSLTDNGASENSLLAPSGDQDNSIFAMNKIANGFSIGDIASFSPSNMPFPPCQILTNFPGTSDQRPSEFGRSRGSRKEKKRTECINNAFSELRRRIPNVPMDTKLSKIKTLRLATSYIAYLTDIVQSADPSDERDGRDFRADLKALRTRERRRQLCQTATSHMSCNQNGADLLSSTVSRCNRAATDSPSQHKVKKKNKGRTGWPEAVWAMELGNITPRGGFQIPTPETTISQEEYRNCYSRNGDNGPVISGVYSLHHLAKDGQQPSCDGTSDQMRQINTIVPYNFKIESPMLSNPTLCHVGQYTGNEDTIPYFPYPPLPLPGASSFSKKLPSIPLFVPEIREFHHNGHSTQVEPFLGSRAVEQDQDVGVHQATGQSTFATVSAMPDIRVHQNEQSNDPMGQSVLGNTPIISEIHEERRNGDLPMYIFDKDATLTGPSFVELKTVSAASIRISTSTINGLATFTTTGRPEMQCFGATRVAESGSRS